MNYLVRDLLETVAAFGLFVPIFVAPGYVVGRFTNVLSFRESALSTRFFLSVLLSLVVSPILTYLLARFGSFHLVWAAYGIVGVVFLLLVRWRSTLAAIRSDPLFGGSALILTGWLLIGLLSHVDLDFGDVLYRGGAFYDYIKHNGVTDAITRTGLPPVNPFYHPGQTFDLYYYYFWHLLSSLVDRLGGALVGPNGANHAGSLWAGIALIGCTGVCVRRLIPGEASHAGIRSFVAMLLLAVSGLDIIFALPNDIIVITIGRGFSWDGVDTWNYSGQIPSWLSSPIWVPQHVSAFVASMTGFLLVRGLSDAKGMQQQFLTGLLAAFAFASSAGMSVWVTLVAAVSLFVWIVVLFLSGERRAVGAIVAIGVGAMFVSLPFLSDLVHASHTTTLPVAFAVRDFRPVLRYLEYRGIYDIGILRHISNLAFLPFTYFLELGFFAVAGVFYWRERVRRRQQLTRDEALLVVLFGTSVVLCSFVTSVILLNDFGWRGIMFAQFVLVLWSVDLIPTLFRRISQLWERNGEKSLSLTLIGRKTLIVLLVTGAATSAYDLFKRRCHDIAADMLHDGQNGREAHALRELYEQADRILPRSAIIQYNPDSTKRIPTYSAELYGNRQIVVDVGLSPLFGIPKAMVEPVIADVTGIFRRNAAPEGTMAICRRYGIDALVVTTHDDVWQDRGSWMWRHRPLIGNDHARLYGTQVLMKGERR